MPTGSLCRSVNPATCLPPIMFDSIIVAFDQREKGSKMGIYKWNISNDKLQLSILNDLTIADYISKIKTDSFVIINNWLFTYRVIGGSA